MFSRINRFHGHNSLRNVYQTGKSAYSQRAKLMWVPAGSLRVAVVVSKKVHKSAVVRNRIRRRLYEILRTYMLENGVAKASIVLVVQNESLATAPAEEVREEIVSLLQKMDNIL